MIIVSHPTSTIMKYLFSLIFLGSLVNGLFAQTITRLDGNQLAVKEIDARIQQWMQEENIQGLCVSVLNQQQPVFIKAYGYRNQPKNEWLDTATIMYGASLSKGVFGFLVMQLVDKGILNLDKPLYQYLPKPLYEYEYFADLKSDDRWKQITARMCLSHTTGLPNLRWFHPATNVEDTTGFLRIYLNPGTRYAYSGEGFKLLQLVIETITQKTVDALAVEYIFNPLGMKRTGYVWHDSFGDDNVAVGHMNNGAIDKKKKRSTGVAGGSMVTTIADYTRFIAAVMQQKELSAAGRAEMLRPQIAIHAVTQFPPITEATTTENDSIGLAYGLGWGLFQCSPYGKAFFKEGNGDSWRNYNVNFVDKGFSITILVNSENGERIFKKLTTLLAGETCIPWKWEGYL